MAKRTITDEQLDDPAKELFEHIAHNHNTTSSMSTEDLLERLAEPGDLDNLLVVNELFRRGALYQIIAKYPDDKDALIDVYNRYCLINKLVKNSKGGA